jgi:excinuclease UvrABC nuclease subunit
MIKLRSGIITWNRDNITRVPDTSGVYVLRTKDYSILEVGIAKNSLVKDLKKCFKSNHKVVFFDWYTTNKEEELVDLSADWKSRYDYSSC